MDLLSHSIQRGKWAVQGQPAPPPVVRSVITRIPIPFVPSRIVVPAPVDAVRLAMPPRFARVVIETAKHYKLTVKELLADNRTHRVTLPRQVIMYIFVEKMRVSLTRAGRWLGGKDHTTVLHGKRKIARELEEHSAAIDAIMGACHGAA